LGRAPNRIAYTGADLFECAACHVLGLAKNHGYHDANERIACMSGWTFLRLNGWSVRAAPDDVIRVMLDVATDGTDEAAIAAWPRARCAAARRVGVAHDESTRSSLRRPRGPIPHRA